MTGDDIRSIEEREALLDKEITERQKLKDAYRLVREDLARSHGQNGSASQDDAVGLWPELSGQGDKEYGRNTKLVRLAISKMTDDYHIRDIYAFLRGHGYQIGMSAIGIVLNRLKKTGEIKERVPGSGRRPALYRKRRL